MKVNENSSFSMDGVIRVRDVGIASRTDENYDTMKVDENSSFSKKGLRYNFIYQSVSSPLSDKRRI